MKKPRARRNIAIGAGAAAAVGAAVLAGTFIRRADMDAPPESAVEAVASPAAICLKGDPALVEAVEGKCFAPGEIAAFLDRPVLGNDGKPLALSLTHPGDETRPPETVTTCKEYNARIDEGWYALTTREMRRQDFFIRACGVLDMLARARRARTGYFENDALDRRDVAMLAASGPFGLAAAAAAPPTVEATGDFRWRIASNGQQADLQELAYADFSRDGRGDILVFVTVTAQAGTARASLVGYLHKDSPQGPVTFIERPQKRGR